MPDKNTLNRRRFGKLDLGDLSLKYPPPRGESLGAIWWPYAASLSIIVFSAHSLAIRLPERTCVAFAVRVNLADFPDISRGVR